MTGYAFVHRLRLSGAVALRLAGSGQAQKDNMTFFITSVGPRQGRRPRRPRRRRCALPAARAGGGRGQQDLARLSEHQCGRPGGAVNARDRIGNGPWQNAKGAVIAQHVADLHSDNNKINSATALNEKGELVKVRGDTPNMHDMLTGSDLDGQAFPAQYQPDLQQLDQQHLRQRHPRPRDREGIADTVFQKSWISSHMSRSCSQPDLVATGGNGLFYCFSTSR